MEKTNLERFNDLVSKVENWGRDRGFYKPNGTTTEHQLLKFTEEFGELAGNLARSKSIKDDIGDCIVVLIHMARLSGHTLSGTEDVFQSLYSENSDNKYLVQKIYDHMYFAMNTHRQRGFILTFVTLKKIAENEGLDVLDCLEFSYNEIKDRKGQMVNSVFVKEADL